MDVKSIIENNKDRYLNELFELLRIPSISADSAYNDDVRKCAGVLSGYLSKAGADNVEICETKGHPIVYGEKIIDPSLTTILVYGHYDVQPADPIDLWDSPPFEPVIKPTDIHPDGAIFARGSCDDKGQMFMQLKAFEIMMQENELPCNVKFMLEGEEEVGSANLESWVVENKERLTSDIILISDTGIISNDCPSIMTGLRGLSYLEVEVTGPNRDLHSGLYGGTVPNPINILCDMINALKDENQQITIPGFYDDVNELSQEERDLLNMAPFDKQKYCDEIGINDIEGEAGYTTIERKSIRPTLDVNGIWGGYIGEGAKTVIPSQAFAKISMRLVPNQDSETITKLFQSHFESIAPKSVKVKVKPHHGGEAAVTPTDSIAYKAASNAMEKTFGMKPIPTRGGGSIPIVAMFEKQLGTKTVLLGFGLNTDAIHSPNEHYGVFNYLKGIETIPYFYKYYTELT